MNRHQYVYRMLSLACMMLVAAALVYAGGDREPPATAWPVGSADEGTEWHVAAYQADVSGSNRIIRNDGPTEEELGQAIVSAASQDHPCLAKMETLLSQLELDFIRMEKESVNVPLRELNGMLQRRPIWNEVKRACWSK